MKKSRLLVVGGLLSILAFGFNAKNSYQETHLKAEEISIVDISQNEEQLSSEITSIEVKDSNLPQWLKDILTPQVLATALQIITTLTVIIKLARDLNTLRKKEQMTLSNVTRVFESESTKTIKNSVENGLNALISPLQKDNEENKKTLRIMAKVFALSQQNTPESRIAVLDLIGQLGIEKAVIEESKKIIKKQEDEKVEKQESLKKEIETIEEKIETPTY